MVLISQAVTFDVLGPKYWKRLIHCQFFWS